MLIHENLVVHVLSRERKRGWGVGGGDLKADHTYLPKAEFSRSKTVLPNHTAQILGFFAFFS